MSFQLVGSGRTDPSTGPTYVIVRVKFALGLASSCVIRHVAPRHTARRAALAPDRRKYVLGLEIRDLGNPGGALGRAVKTPIRGNQRQTLRNLPKFAELVKSFSKVSNSTLLRRPRSKELQWLALESNSTLRSDVVRCRIRCRSQFRIPALYLGWMCDCRRSSDAKKPSTCSMYLGGMVGAIGRGESWISGDRHTSKRKELYVTLEAAADLASWAMRTTASFT